MSTDKTAPTPQGYGHDAKGAVGGKNVPDGGVAVTFYTEEDIEFVRDIANIIVASERAAGKEESDVARLLASFPKVSKEKKKNKKRTKENGHLHPLRNSCG